ncbi:MAG: M13 family metallopeptidase [Prevotellaceae bacterium]|nr:M13 family metallopeptidase [Prevotellaceae bacterium]
MMMKKYLLLTSLFIMILSACNHTSKVSGIDLSNIDTTARPSDDFFQYACGGWMTKNPMKAEHARYGSFDKLRDENTKQVNDLIRELAAKTNAGGSVAAQIATLYNVGMDSVTLNRQGAEPLLPLLEKVAAANTPAQIAEQIIALHRQAIYPFFGLFAEADFSNSKMDIAWLFQAGLGMDERDYYLDDDDRTKDIRARYITLLTNMFRLSTYDRLVNARPEQLAKAVLSLETQLAEAFMSRHDLRDPHKMFNKKALDEVIALAPGFDFGAYFRAMGLPELQSLNVGQPDYIKAFGTILATAEPDVVKAYLAWNIIRESAPYLSDAFVNENFEFYGRTMSGMQELRPRWKRVVDNVNNVLGEAVGQLYVAKYFPPAAKERMLKLVKNLQETLGERIQAASWMDSQTKEKALEKLGTFHIKIGYPDKWRDYSSLEIKADSYLGNILRSNAFEVDYMLHKIDRPKDVDEWGMTPQTVNAYYNPTTNEICFPAAILQPPFFMADADNAANYGAIGVVIGHEMTHGFDDQGRQYDRDGNLHDWWQPVDAENFEQRAQVLVDYFNKIEVLPGTFADGKYTLGENIADNGGLQISFQAMTKAKAAGEIADNLDAFTAEQRFFIAYATVWAGHIREQEILRLTKQDVHSLGRWRVNGTLPHIAAFIEAFHIQPGDKMYLSKDEQAAIW